MGKNKVIKVAAATAAAVVICGPAQAAQPTVLAEIICGNNGSGNGDEIIMAVAVGGVESRCMKFQPLNGDTKPASPGNNIDLDPQSSNSNYGGPNRVVE